MELVSVITVADMIERNLNLLVVEFDYDQYGSTHRSTVSMLFKFFSNERTYRVVVHQDSTLWSAYVARRKRVLSDEQFKEWFQGRACKWLSNHPNHEVNVFISDGEV